MYKPTIIKSIEIDMDRVFGLLPNQVYNIVNWLMFQRSLKKDKNDIMIEIYISSRPEVDRDYKYATELEVDTFLSMFDHDVYEADPALKTLREKLMG